MLDLSRLNKNLMVRDFVAHTCVSLNKNQWHEFLAQCDTDDFAYSIENYSPEIKKRQCWMRQNCEGLKHVIDLLPKHNSDHAQLTRHITTYSVQETETADVYDVNSQLAIYRTEWDSDNSHLKSGATTLYVIGSYLDQVAITPSGIKLRHRTVELETRQVGTGSHFIL